MLRRACKILSRATFLMLYNTIVLPLFDCFSSVWDSCGVGSKVFSAQVGADELKSTLS